MKKSFTLMEIIIVVIILGILVTIGIPIYNNVMENAKVKVCETNQKVLLQAVEAYGLENDQLPGTLSDLKREHLRRAWAKVFREENPLLLKLAYFIVDWDKRSLAYAQEGWIKRYIGDLKYFTCPKDETPPPQGYSYGISKKVAKLSWQEYKNLSPDTVIIADSDEPVFIQPTSRHKKYSLIPGKGPVNFPVIITKDRRTFRIGKGLDGQLISKEGRPLSVTPIQPTNTTGEITSTTQSSASSDDEVKPRESKKGTKKSNRRSKRKQNLKEPGNEKIEKLKGNDKGKTEERNDEQKS